VTSSADAQAIHVWDLRAIREQLAKLGLDWETPPYPHAERPAPTPLRVTVDLGFVDARQSVKTQSDRLALAPGDGEAYLERGQAYARLDQTQKAVADFSMALDLLPAGHIRRAEALLYRSRSHGKLGDHAAARADLQQIAEKDLPLAPELTGIAATACNDLAWQYVTGAEAARDPPKALPLIQKAIQWSPDDPNFANTRGVVHYRLGQYPQAVEWLERSLRESRGEGAAFDLFFLAMCHAKRGDGARAKECYDRAVRWVEQDPSVIKLNPTWGPELRVFRAEADAVLAAGAIE
jgi:tetratricopeptide (TPR) repeat protein